MHIPCFSHAQYTSLKSLKVLVKGKEEKEHLLSIVQNRIS